MCNKLIRRSIESVGQAVGVRSHITFGVDTAALQDRDASTASPRHEGTDVTRDVNSGASYSTAGKSVVWDEGRHLLVSKDSEG